MKKNAWGRFERAARGLMVEGMARGFVVYALAWLLVHAWREQSRDRRWRARPLGHGPAAVDLRSLRSLRSRWPRRVRTSEATTDPPSSANTTTSDTNTGTCTNALSAILMPTNSSTSASPG